MQPFLEATLTNVVMATALAVLAAVVSKLYRRPVLSHFLWLLVLLKLITPPLVPVRLALPAVVEAALMRSPAAHRAEEPASSTVPVPPDFAALDLSHTEAEDILDPNFVLPELAETNPYRSFVPPEQTATEAPAVVWWSELSPWGWACMVWAGGSVLWFILASARLAAFHRLLKHAWPAPLGLQIQAAILAKRMDLPECPEIVVVPGRISPLLWALGCRARVILPADLLDYLAPDEQITLLAHELAHARRRDHWVRWLEFVVTGVYWWLPVVWWARRRLGEAEEQCCDAWVVWMLPAAAKVYAKALLQTVDFLDTRPALPPAASGLGHLYLLKRRLTMIVHERLSPRLPWPVHAGTVLLGMLILPMAPQRLQADSPKEPEAVAALADDEASARSNQQLRELERRMTRMEERLDRALRAIETRTERRGRTEEMERKSSEDREKALAERKRALEERKEDLKKALEAQKEARKQSAEARKLGLDAQRGLEDAARARGKSDFNFKFEWKAEDKAKLKDLDKQIQEMVNKTFSPERMKDLEKQIQGLVEKNVNPEQMKDLDRQIQRLVERTVSPERIQALQKQIEAIVARSMATEQRERARRPEQPRAPQAVERPATPAAPRVTTRGTASNQRDLERRLDNLERKMDRVLQALEARQKGNKERDE